MNPQQAHLELRNLEPLFHRPENHGANAQDFDRLMAPTFFEIGASGKIHDRPIILDTLITRHADANYAEPELVISGFGVHPIAPGTWLTSYTLQQPGDRLTRRATLWQHSADGWQALYHQGTIVQPA